MERRLATIMASDVVGYSARMEASESETIRQLGALTRLIGDQVRRFGGRVFSRAGDGFLSEFQSPVMAVQAGFEIQRMLRAPDNGQSYDLQLRIGIHLADAIVDGEDLLGDGVNIASRVEGVADPGSVVVTQTVFDQVKRTATLKFENLGERPLKNISEPIRLYRVTGDLENHSYITGTTLPARPAGADRPINSHSLVVLPFANLSGDPEQEYFSDGFSEDLITELSRFRDIFLVSRNASFAYKGRTVDLRQAGRELGVAYCLEGSVRKLGSNVRITCQLVETETGNQVWAEKYDCKLDQLFDVQDDLAASIVSRVAGRIERQARVVAKRKRPADMQANDCLLRGLEHHRLGGVTRESAEEALRWFTLAVEKDPNYACAHAWQACAMATLMEWTGEDRWAEIRAIGQRGLELDDDDAECHRIVGALSLYARKYDEAEYHYQRALELNPNHAYIVGRIGDLYNFLGDGQKALKYQLRAKQLDPFLPVYCRELEAVAHYVLGEYAATVAVVDELTRTSRRAAAYRVAACAHIDNPERLESAVRELRVIDPEFTINGFLLTEFYRDRALRQQLHDDLAKAGLSQAC
ncbi:adenylate/guanylate cyclase domain-containing protein [Rhizobiaceae bacterium n13]|uniref:Adenylate/guanylate cyclase domain-containing protein n=1 Tax=Ferirhizobium litorale TaxID=2927786 RepID=A0AAE3U321_9HYPH|nr:adenylate/guanylate cyclase domain-containing protein [Fererhizobium litorale]MDI7861498.1 adenylate/guanylate cyclase domain-containing protein [Fererhizobium litorale]MDI7921644.1 adenylate/guanylate cyclase domain-containing protein [Fererhizobium litorale]